MEENNRKGPGIFYAVVGVATLVVAIIGATFAFFSASATNNNVITGTTANAGGITLSVLKVTNTNSNLIPLNLIENSTESDKGASQFTDAFTNSAAKGIICQDSNDNNVCQVYKITVTNNSTTATIQVRGTLALTSEATNMYWKLISGEDDGASTPALTSGSEVAYATNNNVASVNGTDATGANLPNGVGHLTVAGNSGGAANGKEAASMTLGPQDDDSTNASNTTTYYVVVWLEEMGVAQEAGTGKPYSDDSQNYSGVVTFNAVDASGNESGITASFTA